MVAPRAVLDAAVKRIREPNCESGRITSHHQRGAERDLVAGQSLAIR
jgi:hypothetical protein